MKYCYINNSKIEEKLTLYFEKLKIYFEGTYPNHISVCLIGSLSKGEGTWVLVDDKPYLISDIEYFIIYEKASIDRNVIDQNLKRIERQVFGYESTSTFHIDYTYLKHSCLSKMEKKFIVFEAKVFGKTVCGKDLQHLFPEVTIDNINDCDTKDILNHNAFSILYYGKWRETSGSPLEYCYLLGKNGLGLLSLYLCMSGILEPGFIGRVHMIRRTSDDTELIKYFERCLEIKLDVQNISHCDSNKMEELFVEKAIFLSKEYKVRWRSIKKNWYHIIRRFLGIVKRGIKAKCFFVGPRKHFNEMIDTIHNGCDDEVRKRICKEHYVLYGFPMIFFNKENRK